MADLRPFRAFRPPASLAPKVASPPYDVINTAEARKLCEGNPASFLHVSRPEVDHPEGTDEHADEVYATGRDNLRRLIEEGALRQDPEPYLYLYAQRMGDHRQVGVVGCASVAQYTAGSIKKHEKTRADKEDDRTRHIKELGAHDEPVFLTYRASERIDALVAESMRLPPVYDFSTGDGVGHQLWVLDRATSDRLARSFDGIEALYVADGHHRSAAAARVHRELRGDGGEHDVFLVVAFPHDQMQIMAYNRVVRDPQGRSAESILSALQDKLDISPASRPEPEEPLSFGLYLGKAAGQGAGWYRARVRSGTFDASDPVASLDASICQDQILGPLFDVKDPRRDSHVDFVGGIRGAAELERRVDEGGFSLALYLYPTRIEQLIAVSDANRLMPPKSTWFEPKLRSGLFVHAF
jgi:uncharacterized protein (DUF1015 family)